VCCDTACTGICERCDLTGTAGSCSPSPLGQDPDHECEKAGQHQNCASRCDGARHCTPIPDGLQCGDCLVCDFLGQCGSCGAFACLNKACLRSCSGPGDCAPGAVCNSSGTCVGAAANGASCQNDGSCVSGHCVDGACCATACTLQPQSTCGRNGQCKPEGGGCADYPASAVCAPPSCANGFLTAQRTCDGSGTCSAAVTAPCTGDYACSSAQSCGTTCSQDDQCRAGFFCHGGACVAHSQADGQACNVGPDCIHSNCVNGTCCASACTAQAQSTCGETGLCAADGSHCLTWPDGTACRDQSCVSSTYTASATCSGGSCPAPSTKTCGTGCDAGGLVCNGDCTPGTQTGCTGGAWCRLVATVPTCVSNGQQPGDPCANGTDCTTAHCDHSICCASGTCCTSPSGCPATAHACLDQTVCSGQDTTYACTSFKCESSTSRNDGDCSGLLANACGHFRDSVCTGAAVQSPSCPGTCAPGGIPDDSLCDAGYYCSSGACVAKVVDGGGCTAANQCAGGTCDNILGICCSGTNCCNAPADCPASYTTGATCTDPTNCMGTAFAATCVSHTCGTAGSATRYDGACNYALNTTHFHTCAGNLAYYCNGAALQDAVAGCPTSCGVINEFCGPGCGQFRCDPHGEKCAPGHSCVLNCTASGTCSGANPALDCSGTCN
jgi:hypothetical protein